MRIGQEVFRNVSIRAPLFAGLLLATTGCSTMRMVPPKDVVQQSDVFEATERSLFSGALVDESFRLGPYEVAGVDRDWNHSSRSQVGVAADERGGTVLGYSNEEIGTSFAFQFKEGADTEAGLCASVTQVKGLSVGSHELSRRQTRFVCTCGAGEAPARLEMELEGRSQGPVGQITLARGQLDVKGVHKTNAAWGSNDAVGYRVDQGPEPLGAVEVLRPGSIWLAKSLDSVERRQLGCLFTGMMLYLEPSTH